ncbi:MAG: hypothetical protein IPK85_23240 [Gemmatimonadetes bacterium]|nr:hypothetical protein [Gemmatimonadota bacterium]
MKRAPLVAALVVALHVRSLAAQHGHAMPTDSARLSIGAMATGVYSHAAPGPFKVTISEAYLTQPMVFGTWRSPRRGVRAYLTINAEGATLQRGEINPGVYGEGYVDRRHPHTWLHEAMVGASGTAGNTGWSLFVGKGFVPYGTDDPMVRPFVKYPVNHHHAQLLERAMVTGAVTWRGSTLEVASFNGDEPESTTDWPNADRSFDSWSARFTTRPTPALELSASLARVESPEFAAGFGLDQRKHAANARYASTTGPGRYLLLEYARTREFSGPVQAFDFDTWLAEGSVTLPRGFTISSRLERTIRPEEERATSFFRTVRPLHDFNIIGRTRWWNTTVALSGPGGGTRWLTGRPFMEVGYHVPRATRRPTALDPVELFGARQVWMVSAGVRLHAGQMRARFGRYSQPQ